ncbi:hypothetical protein HYW44_02640 [Candidatus Daviesbacteria bacterium]|nr:hypothetical protein [Candidatus Daviesbacteria bacterium]
MTNDRGLELGAIYRDPSFKAGRGDVFKTTNPNTSPTRAELDLKIHRAPEDGYDHYGFFDPKMRAPSFLRSARRISVYQ